MPYVGSTRVDSRGRICGRTRDRYAEGLGKMSSPLPVAAAPEQFHLSIVNIILERAFPIWLYVRVQFQVTLFSPCPLRNPSHLIRRKLLPHRQPRNSSPHAARDNSDHSSSPDASLAFPAVKQPIHLAPAAQSVAIEHWLEKIMRLPGQQRRVSLRFGIETHPQSRHDTRTPRGF
jgi:hypothetical protein